MKTWKILTISLVAVLTLSVTAVTALAYYNWASTPQLPVNYYSGPNMMPRNSASQPYTTGQNPQTNQYMQTEQMPYSTSPADTTQTQIPSETPQLTTEEPPVLYTPQQYQTAPQTGGYGWGWGGGCMGRGYYGTAPYPNTQQELLTINQALEIAQNYVNYLNNPDLSVDEIEEFTANFYVLIKEKSTGYGAFEVLINKYTGTVTPEIGPNMMWNTKYSFRNGYCNWFNTAPTTTPTITLQQAKTYAQQYLDTYYPETTTGDSTTFYGYYTIEVLNNSGIYGMLSVNSYTGQVWFHTWHGTFIQEIEA